MNICINTYWQLASTLVSLGRVAVGRDVSRPFSLLSKLRVAALFFFTNAEEEAFKAKEKGASWQAWLATLAPFPQGVFST